MTSRTSRIGALTAAAALASTLTIGLAAPTLALAQAAQQSRAYASPDAYRDQRTLPDPSDPSSHDALLRARGETYHRADDSKQTEEELRATRALNAEIVARNEQADKDDAAARLDYETALARHQVEVRQNEEQARAAAEATRAAQDQYDREFAAWREQVRLCQSGVRAACGTPVPTPR